ncbi:MAG TPA: ABC-three component system middle component 1 [Mucilaginibacter sp.]|jgi:hypothetical protein|nr:ABC-three component system middle component 1 [Mucilaginibacter sp.]
MKPIIRSIFSERGFVQAGNLEDTFFFHSPTGGRSEYYVIDFISAANLQTYDAERAYEVMISYKSAFHDVEKNSSLILCVEFNDLQNQYHQYKNAMLKIEEDEFWFKKYLLPYTAPAVNHFNLEIAIIPQLNELVLNETQFNAFRQNIFIGEAFFLAIQCFLKLPFLAFTPVLSADFVTIEQTMQSQLSTWELTMLYEKITPFDNNADDWEARKVIALDTRSDDFDEFLNNYFENVQS